MCDYSQRCLNRAARDAEELGCDGTDYGQSAAARSFVPFYAQRMSWAAIKGSADCIHAHIAKLMRDRLRHRPKVVGLA